MAPISQISRPIEQQNIQPPSLPVNNDALDSIDNITAIINAYRRYPHPLQEEINILKIAQQTLDIILTPTSSTFPSNSNFHRQRR